MLPRALSAPGRMRKTQWTRLKTAGEPGVPGRGSHVLLSTAGGPDSRLRSRWQRLLPPSQAQEAPALPDLSLPSPARSGLSEPRAFTLQACQRPGSSRAGGRWQAGLQAGRGAGAPEGGRAHRGLTQQGLLVGGSRDLLGEAPEAQGAHASLKWSWPAWAGGLFSASSSSPLWPQPSL